MLVLASLWGVYYAVDTKLAWSEDLQRVEIKIDQYIVSQEVRDLKQRIFDIQMSYGEDVRGMPPLVGKQYQCLQLDLEREQTKLKQLKGE